MNNKIVIITGTTASGKTAYSIDLARKLDGEIINCDSMQIYAEIPILSAQPTLDEQGEIPHHLFGFVSLAEQSNTGKWLHLALEKIHEIKARGKTPIFVGGTGLYIKSLIHGIAKTPEISSATKEKVKSLPPSLNELQKVDPKTAQRLEEKDMVRIQRALEVYYQTGTPISELHNTPHDHPYSRSDFYLTHVERDREEIYNRINQRFLDMLEMGALEECQKAYQKLGDIVYPKAHGLPEIIRYINNDMKREEMISKSQQNVRNYAKRQLTFFRHQFTFDEKVILK